MKDASELLLSDLSLPERIVILEELAETDAVLLHLSLELEHQVSDGLLSHEHSLSPNVLVLLGLVELLHLLLKGLEGRAIVDELEVFDLVVVCPVERLHGSHLFI